MYESVNFSRFKFSFPSRFANFINTTLIISVIDRRHFNLNVPGTYLIFTFGNLQWGKT